MGNHPVSSFDPDGGWSWLGAKFRQFDVWVSGRSPSKLINSGSEWGFNTMDKQGTIFPNYSGGVSLGHQFLDNTPVFGWGLLNGDQLVDGDYIGAAASFGMAIAEGATLGYGSIWGKPAQHALSTTSKSVVHEATKGVDGLLNARNTLDKGSFTVVGRALQKHGSRTGSIYPKATGNTAAINTQGEAVLKGILTNPNTISVTRHHARFGNVLEYRIPGGQGARFSGDGKKFIGFLE